ncbi:MAG: ParB/RepB/Spo0J family partition protein [bacterium]
MGKRKALGRGLEALLPGSVAEVLTGDEILSLPVNQVHPNPDQPRKEFDQEALQSLADSIKAQGVLQPILVVKTDDGFELVAGERRLKASILAGKTRIPALVLKEKDPTALFFFSLVENLQREDLNPIEEAFAYRHLIEDFGLTQEQVAARVGKSRSAVANTLRLLTLPMQIQDYISDGSLSAGHARAILAVDDEERMMRLAKLAISRGLSVERLDIIARQEKPSPRHSKGGTKSSAKKALSPEIKALQEELEEYFGTKVVIENRAKGGSIVIDYYSKDDLMRIIELLSDN